MSKRDRPEVIKDHPNKKQWPTVDRQSELDPKCINGGQEAFAITNRMELLPCCWLDTQINRTDKDYIQLLWASRIYDYDSIEEIFLTDEWIKFKNDLEAGKGFPVCHVVCKKRENPQHKREKSIRPDGKGYVKET